ncbi:MAG: hypothetical protein FWH40_07395 [Coriobacteriia bacterium]|nr:hypothetical protein [Coriobacteriia bacterium]
MHNKLLSNKKDFDTGSLEHLDASHSGMLLTRRQAVSLLAMGGFSLAGLQLTGCYINRYMRRIALMERLLSEKYAGREFAVVGGDYGYETSLHPVAYCIERGVDDLVFEARFQINVEELVTDAFVERKLGRQVEDLIIDCFKKQGIEAAPIGLIRTKITDPDITLDEFIAKAEELRGYFFDIVIPESLESPRSSEPFFAAMLEVFTYIKTSNGILIQVARDEDFAAYQEYVRQIPTFYAPRDPKRPIIDGFYIMGPAPHLVIDEGDTWKNYSH